ncbi:unnamed protein product, partial [Rotaria sp. Silwood2]
MLISHPFVFDPSQFAYPLSQLLTTQVPLEHLATAFANEQVALHDPQWLTSVYVLISHPFALDPSQLAYPLLQLLTTQVAFEQPATAFANEQVALHDPQWLTSVYVLSSHPFAFDPSQLAYPLLQLLTTQVAFEQ